MLAKESTLTTEQVKAAADWGRDWIVKGPEFDRWLASHDAEYVERIRELELQVAARDAVLAEARKYVEWLGNDDDPRVDFPDIETIVYAAPDSVLAAHDAEVKAQALADAREAVAALGYVMDPDTTAFPNGAGIDRWEAFAAIDNLKH